MKLTIWHGKQKPMIAIGKNQCRLLEFAHKYPQWHTFRQDAATKRAVMALHLKGYLDIHAAGDMFKIKYQ